MSEREAGIVSRKEFIPLPIFSPDRNKFRPVFKNGINSVVRSRLTRLVYPFRLAIGLIWAWFKNGDRHFARTRLLHACGCLARSQSPFCTMPKFLFVSRFPLYLSNAHVLRNSTD